MEAKKYIFIMIIACIITIFIISIYEAVEAAKAVAFKKAV